MTVQANQRAIITGGIWSQGGMRFYQNRDMLSFQPLWWLLAPSLWDLGYVSFCSLAVFWSRVSLFFFSYRMNTYILHEQSGTRGNLEWLATYCGVLCAHHLHALMYYFYLLAKPSYLMSIFCHLKGPLRLSSELEDGICGLTLKDVYQCASCLFESLEQQDFGILKWLNISLELSLGCRPFSLSSPL